MVKQQLPLKLASGKSQQPPPGYHRLHESPSEVSPLHLYNRVYLQKQASFTSFSLSSHGHARLCRQMSVVSMKYGFSVYATMYTGIIIPYQSGTYSAIDINVRKLKDLLNLFTNIFIVIR